MSFNSEFRKIRVTQPISSGDSTLDELLGGGFYIDLVYVLFGDKKATTNILLTTSVISQKTYAQGGVGGNEVKVAFIDVNNRFNPYNVSKFAVSQNLSPRLVLENILIARAFTWDQMIELIEHRLSKLEQVKVVLISGITTLFQSYEKQTFEDLLKGINVIKSILQKAKPLIVITAPLNECSSFRPKGGKILSHFGNVMVLINDEDRYVEYIIVQHPFLPAKRLLKQKPKVKKVIDQKDFKTLDYWF